MTEPHWLMLLPALVCLGCTVLSPRGRKILDWVGALVMAAAMGDLALGLGVLAPFWWCLLLAAVGIALALRARANTPGQTPSRDPAPPLGTRMHLFHGLSFLAMAALTVASHGSSPGQGHQHGRSAGLLPMLAAVILAGFAATLAVALLRSRGPRARVHATEVGGMGAMLLVMALPM